MENTLPKRKHPRLKTYDYSTSGAYFITVCAHNRRCLFAKIIGHEYDSAEIQYSPHGKIAREQLFLLEERYPSLKVDQFVIMPNHIHAIFILEETAGASPRPTIQEIVCAYKSLTTRACKKAFPTEKVFQTSFYDHVIRGQEDYLEIAEYIANNPKQWELDKLYAEQ